MARKKLSRAAKVRNMLDKGMKPRDIADQLVIPVQTVYNIRYQYNKKKGVGALPKPPLSQDGIATVRRRARADVPPIVVPPVEEKPVAPGRVVEVPANAFSSPNTFPWWWVVFVGAVVTLVAVVAIK